LNRSISKEFLMRSRPGLKPNSLIFQRFHWVSLAGFIVFQFFGGALAHSLCAEAVPIALTHDGRAKQDPVFSPTGEFLDFTVYETQIQMSLIRLNLSNGVQTRFNPAANTNEFELGYSRTGSHAAFVQSRGNLNLKLVIRDLTSGQDAVFDPGGGFNGMHCPTFTPAGDRVLFSQPGKGGQQLVSVNLQGQDRKEITTWAGMTNWPTFSPDGKDLLFASSRDGDFDLYLMGPDGGNLRRLTEGGGRDIRPRFSPDGRQIVFVSVRDGNSEIYVMTRDGTNVRRITNNVERDDYPLWHPNGLQIIWVAERGGKMDFYQLEVPR